VRWLWYLTIARLFDGLVVLLAAGFLPWYYLFLRKWGSYRIPLARMNFNELIGKGPKDDLRTEIFSDSKDTHNLMCQIGHGFFHPKDAPKMAALALTPKGSLFRKVPWGFGLPPSRDLISAWTYFYVVCGLKEKHLVESLASHHWGNVFGLRDKLGNLSSRAANGGVAFLGNKKVSGPNAGQGYLATAGLLALAAKELGGKWKFRYHFYRIMSFGWFWERFPWLPFKGRTYPYVGHTCQMSLYVLHKCGHNMENGLRWVAVTCQPKQGIQPFVAGMAADCGVLTDKEKANALQWLLSQNVNWPQHFDLARWDENCAVYSMYSHCAVQLTSGGKNVD